MTNYTGTGISEPEGIVAGPDGALWFTNPGNNSIGRITTAGKVKNYTGTGIKHPSEHRGRSRRGAVVHRLQELDRADHHRGNGDHYTGSGIRHPWGIAAGPDGALWFTNDGNDSIGRITTAGTVTQLHRERDQPILRASRPDPTGHSGSPTTETVDRADHHLLTGAERGVNR